MDHKGALAGALGWGSLGYSWLVAATEVAQFIGAILGIIATSFAIYFYIRQIKKGDNANRPS